MRSIALLTAFTKPSGLSDPPPKKYFSISPTRNFRAFGSKATSRYSLISIVWCPSHFCQASFETFSKMRCPSSPGYGGRSRPSASRPSFTQWTIRAISHLLEQSCHGRGQSDRFQCGKFVPAGVALRGQAPCRAEFEHPGLDREIKMRECMPDGRQPARRRARSESRRQEGFSRSRIGKLGRRPQPAPDAARRAALEQHAAARDHEHEMRGALAPRRAPLRRRNRGDPPGRQRRTAAAPAGSGRRPGSRACRPWRRDP